jgi:hypothetical protein
MAAAYPQIEGLGAAVTADGRRSRNRAGVGQIT